jgi:hypothetical protein
MGKIKKGHKIGTKLVQTISYFGDCPPESGTNFHLTLGYNAGSYYLPISYDKSHHNTNITRKNKVSLISIPALFLCD